jgi:hypothetical protein
MIPASIAPPLSLSMNDVARSALRGPSSVHQYSDKLIAKKIKKRRKKFRLAIHSRRSIIRENYMSKLAIVGAFPFIVSSRISDLTLSFRRIMDRPSPGLTSGRLIDRLHTIAQKRLEQRLRKASHCRLSESICSGLSLFHRADIDELDGAADLSDFSVDNETVWLHTRGPGVLSRPRF